MPPVGGIRTGGTYRSVPIGIFCISSIVDIVADLAAVAGAFSSPFFCSGLHRYYSTLGEFGRFSDDVNDAVNRIGPPQCRPRTTDDFNAIHIFQHDVLHVPIHSREQGGVDAPAVDENQQLVVETAIEASRADGPLVLVDASYFEAGNESQSFWNAGGA